MNKSLGLPPRVAAVHDLSCFGRCALTVIIPTLSCLGVQTVPLPTALLSTHTGGFENMHFRDLTEDMTKIADHFDRLSMSFDAVYSGFLGSAAQITVVSDFIDRFGADIPVLVDPVMGDDGKLYSTYNSELVNGMKALCRKAKIITPNHTEACILTGLAYEDTENMSEKELLGYGDRLLDALADYRVPRMVLTGLANREGVYTFGMQDGERFVCKENRLHAGYPGTGDIFASVLLGLLLSGKSFEESVGKASRFTALTIQKTMQFPTPVRDGVVLESCMDELMRMVRTPENGLRRGAF